jgi:Domain of unknown function (DUF4037)
VIEADPQTLAGLRELVIGRYAIAIGGSHAKGRADDHSDVDFYLFAEEVVAAQRRHAIATRLADSPGSVKVGGHPDRDWGTNIDFVRHGVLVEATVRGIALIEAVLAQCLAGEIVASPMLWTPGGWFYNHATLADLHTLQPVEDAYGLLAGWRSRVATYPPALASAIIHRHLPLAGFWLDNAHYRAAIARGDAFYTQSIVVQALHHLMQVLYAVNETYFPGDKRALEYAAEFRRAPDRLRDTLDWLMFPGRPTVPVLAEQREVLARLVSQTRRLAHR